MLYEHRRRAVEGVDYYDGSVKVKSFLEAARSWLLSRYLEEHAGVVRAP